VGQGLTPEIQRSRSMPQSENVTKGGKPTVKVRHCARSICGFFDLRSTEMDQIDNIERKAAFLENVIATDPANDFLNSADRRADAKRSQLICVSHS